MIPDALPYTGDNNWIDLQVRVNDRDTWRGFQIYSGDVNKVYGYVKTLEDSTAIQGAGVNMWNYDGAGGGWDDTDADGYFEFYVVDGTYNLNIWPGQDYETEVDDGQGGTYWQQSLSGYWQDGVEITSDWNLETIYLTEPLYVEMELASEALVVGETLTATISVTSGGTETWESDPWGGGWWKRTGGAPKSGLPDSMFTAWVHDWSDPTDWWSDQVENDYHDSIEIVDGINFVDNNDGTYTITYVIPDALPYNSGAEWLELQVRVNDREDWRGFRIFSGDVAKVYGYVQLPNEDPVEGAEVRLHGPSGNWAETDVNGYFEMYTPDGLYDFEVWPGSAYEQTYGEYFVPFMAVSGDTNLGTITLREPLYLDMEINKEGLLLGDTMTVTFEILSGGTEEMVDGHYEYVGGTAVTDLGTDLLSIWVHQWGQDPGNWWQDPVEGDYHDDLTNNAAFTWVKDGSTDGTYEFTWTVPDELPYNDPNADWFDLEVQLLDARSNRGFIIFTGDVAVISGTVRDAETGTPVPLAEIDLWREGWGMFIDADETGYFETPLPIGQYSIMAEAKEGDYLPYMADLDFTGTLSQDILLQPMPDTFTLMFVSKQPDGTGKNLGTIDLGEGPVSLPVIIQVTPQTPLPEGEPDFTPLQGLYQLDVMDYWDEATSTFKVIFIYGENGGGPAGGGDDGGGQPEWNLDVVVDLDQYQSILNFGVEEGATSGFDQSTDQLAPSPAPSGLNNYFYYASNPTSPVDLTRLTTSLIGFGELSEWDMVVDIPVGLTGLVEVGWDNTMFDQWPGSVSVTLETPGGDVDMRTLDTYTWTSSGDESVTLPIIVEDTTP